MVKYCAASAAFKKKRGEEKGEWREKRSEVVVKYCAASAAFEKKEGRRRVEGVAAAFKKQLRLFASHSPAAIAAARALRW